MRDLSLKRGPLNTYQRIRIHHPSAIKMKNKIVQLEVSVSHGTTCEHRGLLRQIKKKSKKIKIPIPHSL